MKALPAKQQMKRSLSDGQTTIRLPAELSVEMPMSATLAIDTGRRFNKIGLLKDSQTIVVEKLPSFFTEMKEKNFVSGGGFLARNERKGSIKNRLSFSYGGKLYSVGRRAAAFGGTVGLGEDKTVNLLPRILAALTLFNLEGKVNLCLTIPFKDAADFREQEALATDQIKDKLTWSVQGETHKAEINSLLIVPESFYAERFPRIYDSDLPDLRGIPRVVIDLGYQTIIFGVLDEEDCFDPALSVCHDGMGLNQFYSWVAQQCGFDNPESVDFVEAVNTSSETFRPQGSSSELYLTDAIELAADRYLQHLTRLCTESIPAGIKHFVVVGGGAYQFGSRLVSELDWASGFKSPEPDIANVVAQCLGMVAEL